MTERIAIIGAGQAGLQAAVSLRQAKFVGAVTLFGDEPTPPYQRPPLSKAYLKGELERERLFLKPLTYFEQHDVDLRLGERVRLIDRGGRKLVLESGVEEPYDRLLLATGAPPRRLIAPGADLQNIFYLRSLADSDALRGILSSTGRVLIVGAGYIGLEVAAVARAAGREVTVLEMADRVLARVASPPVSDFFEARHRESGVDLRLGATLKGFLGREGAVVGAELVSGEVIDCASVLIGIGAVPAVELAASAGLEVDGGVIVDERARTSDEAIWAAGDCTNFPSPLYNRRMRLESVPNAIEQAKVAATNMAGGDAVYDATPWFWSDQYDVKLQTAGLSEGHDERVQRGDPGSGRFSIWYFAGRRLLAVDAINDPAAFAASKRLIGTEISSPEAIANAEFDLKSLLVK